MARGRDYTPDEQRDPAGRIPLPDRAHEQKTTARSNRAGGPGHDQQAPLGELRTLDHDRDRSGQLPNSELQTLAEIGTFRTVTLEDLARYRYGNHRTQAQAEVRDLTRRGLVRVRTTHPAKAVYVSLTREGHSLIRRHRPHEMNPNQVFYARFVKPREVKHDAALYRLYQEVADRIAREGAKVKRVVLDFELKKSINRQLATLGSLSDSQQTLRKHQIAEEHGLSVVNGKIPLPDLRIEYETADLEQTKVDLELATKEYHLDSLAEKSQAGFAIFALQEDAAPLRRAINDPGLTRDIFSL